MTTRDEPSATEHSPAPDPGTSTSAAPAEQRMLDIESLRGLAHPLRIQLLEILGSRGPLTASGLAHLTGESSGTTSYHLRQLERHGFIQEEPGRGTARERWWRTRPGGFAVPTASLSESSPANREAVSLVNREFVQAQHRHLMAHVEHGTTELPEDWAEASTVTTVNLRVTAEELEEISAELHELSQRVVARYRAGRDRPEARPIQMNLNAFPLMFSEETP